MEESNSLVIFTKAALMLAEADTIQKAHDLKNLALTAAEWAKRKGMGEEAIGHCRSYALEAERKMGEMLISGKDVGRVAIKGQPRKVTVGNFSPMQISELGLTKRESAEAQMLASLPQEIFEKVKTGKKSKTQARREFKKTEVKTPQLPTGKYRVVYADPPWKYGDQLTEDYGPTRFHYPPMSLSELCLLPIKDILEENAVLFLWVTSPILPDAFPLIKEWGFTYKASFVWDKIKHNFGHYNSVRHEFLLICTKGSCLPDETRLKDSVVSIERSGKHSEKPEYFREMIDELYPVGSRIELFARIKREGWETFGNEL